MALHIYVLVTIQVKPIFESEEGATNFWTLELFS